MLLEDAGSCAWEGLPGVLLHASLRTGLRGYRSHQSNKAFVIPPKVTELLSKLLKLTQYGQGKQTGSL